MSSNLYDDEVIDFEVLGQSGDLSLPLYTDPKADPAFAAGQLRTQYEVHDDGITIYHKEETDYSLSIQRLLWVDGWRDKDQNPSQEATLVVLKFVFLSTASSDTATKLQKVKATLQFLDTDEARGQDPEVAAWAPFHQAERFNRTAVHLQNTTSTRAAADLGYSGSKLALERSKEKEVSWDRTCFDEGRAIQVFNKKGRPHGVRWHLTQNRLQNQGVTPEFWAAILVSRASSDPYLARFTINASSGTFEDFTLKAKQAIGLRDDGSSFRVTPTPGRAAVCNLEGKDIIECVDLQHLGNLVDGKTSTKLNVSWGPRYQLHAAAAPGSESVEDETMTEGQAVDPTKDLLCPQTAAVPAPLGLQSDQGDDVTAQQLAACHNATTPTASADSARLVALEARMAQLEARLAAQDTVILQLQQAQLAKDVQVFRLEQALAASKHYAS